MTTSRPFLMIAAEQWVPWCRVHQAEDGTLNISGPIAIILDVFAQQMNFDYQLVRPADRVWGSEYPNGTWSGMIGMLLREEVEIALGPFTVTPQRETASDMSTPIAYDNKALLMVRSGIQNDVAGFLRTFALEVWLLIIVSMATISVAMMCVVWAEGKIFQNPTKHILSKAVLWVFQTLAQESSEWLPKKDGGRLLVATWLLASLVFMSSYSGILTAMLTVPKVTIPIDSLEDLVAQSSIPWRLEGGSSMFHYFQDTTDPLRQRVFRERSGIFKDCWADREAIAAGEFVAVCDETTMKKAMSWDFSTSGKCHLYIGREKVYAVSTAVAFQTKSNYLPKANHIILSLRGGGLIDKWMGDQITNTSQCLRPPTADRSDGISPLNLEAFGGPLLVLVAGLSLATLTFLMEMVVSQLSSSQPLQENMAPGPPPPPPS